MKLDHEYLKELILNIENIPAAHPELKQVLESMGLDDLNDKFVLHYEVIYDYDFIQGAGEPHDIGLEYCDTGLLWANSLIRLTAKGHEFASSLSQPEVWDTLVSNFKEASVETMFSVGKEIAINISKKKLESLLE